MLRSRYSIACVLLSCWMAVGSAASAAPASDDEMDAASMEATAKTQQLLRDPSLRSEAMKQTPQAAWIGKQVESMAGSKENAQKIYELSAEIFADLSKQAGGDPKKMMNLLERAKKDPAAFINSLSPEFRAKLRNVSEKIPAGGATAAPAQPPKK